MLKENEEFIYNFIKNNLSFYPSCDVNDAHLPFAINRPFTVYDISKITDEQMEELVKEFEKIED